MIGGTRPGRRSQAHCGCSQHRFQSVDAVETRAGLPGACHGMCHSAATRVGALVLGPGPAPKSRGSLGRQPVLTLRVTSGTQPLRWELFVNLSHPQLGSEGRCHLEKNGVGILACTKDHLPVRRPCQVPREPASHVGANHGEPHRPKCIFSGARVRVRVARSGKQTNKENQAW